MSVKKPHQKGGRFEGELCRVFSKWLTYDKRDDVFYKTSGSGGRATQRQKLQKQTAFSAGDMSFNDPIGKPFIEYFLVEIKRGYNTNVIFNSLIDKDHSKTKTPLIIDWFKKANQERSQNNRKAVMLLMRRDYARTLVVLKYQEYKKFQSSFNNRYKLSNYAILNLQKEYRLTLIAIPLDTFLRWFKPKKFLGVYKQWKELRTKRPT
ncbi:MAG: hypothetical protein DRJ03_01010 [Chloroflexi bacterium]|nr:MAG: hypothetical protein DRJ03_01010 [Chloroflexota bacterium]